jgi:opacity protein-like surface antigen
MKHVTHLVIAAALAGGAAPASTAAAAAQVNANAEAQGVVGGIIDRLIGNRYNVSDRQAVRHCGSAAVDKAERQYRPYFNDRPHAYPGYNGYVRVTAITDVQRRARGVRVRGLLDTARYGYGNGNRGADLSFRCDTDRRGRVSDVSLQRNPGYRPR